MRQFLKYAFFLAAISAAPAYAQMEVKPIRVHMDPAPQKISIEVEIKNPTTKNVHPKLVALLIRETNSTPWRTLQSWKVPGVVKPGKSMTFVYHPKPVGGKTDPGLKAHAFQVRAKVNGVDSFITSVTGA